VKRYEPELLENYVIFLYLLCSSIWWNPDIRSRHEKKYNSISSILGNGYLSAISFFLFAGYPLLDSIFSLLNLGVIS